MKEIPDLSTFTDFGDYPDNGLKGGQLWKQDNFPHCSRYIVYLGDDRWVMLGDPRERGAISCTTRDGKGEFTKAELLDHLLRHNYVCEGQFSRVIYPRPGP